MKKAQVRQDMEPQTIRNCWRKVGILPLLWSQDISNADERERSRVTSLTDELAKLISGINLGDAACSAEEYTAPPCEDQVWHSSDPAAAGLSLQICQTASSCCFDNTP